MALQNQQNLAKSIAVFLTGGTIGMKRRAGGPGVAPSGGLEELVAEAPELKGVKVRAVEWSDKPSPHITPEDMFRLARDLDEALADPALHGAVVLHGTDLLAETSFFLDLALQSTKPVVTTGSMRHMEESGYDGQRNLLNSLLACLAMPPSSEVLIQLADQLFTARDAAKLDSVSVDPLIGQRRGSVGRIAGEAVELSQNISVARPRVPFKITGLAEQVPLAAGCPGMSDADLRPLLFDGPAPRVQGLVLEGFGAGNVPPGIVPLIQDLLQAKRPVILATRCLKGGVVPLYGYYGGGAALLEMGVISAGYLSGSKAQLLLKAALGSQVKPEELPDIFKNY
ncbi:asparaginase [Desulfovibrio sp. OttesenSCG-928-C14]|nr:asparaginase [Desulfovibrio sp. OttesenSCG-928-C14]